MIGTATGVEGIATWRSRVRRVFNQTTFKRAEPGLYEKYREPKIERTFNLV